ncbi:MAG: hypothetical protein KAI17_21250, partial [Thiotrichaceae bacterium]|nr:hypothetical protein [Thiotrichaceae bacterium]
MFKFILLPFFIITLLISGCASLSGEPVSAKQEINISGIKSDYTAAEYTALCDEILKQAGENFTVIEQDTSIA